MAKTWVLDTETKGTGARVVPIEQARQRLHSDRALATFTFRGERCEAAEGLPERTPLRFRVTDVLSGRELARGVDAAHVVQLLEGKRGVLDARVHVWEPARKRWRLLTLAEHKLLWRFRRS